MSRKTQNYLLMVRKKQRGEVIQTPGRRRGTRIEIQLKKKGGMAVLHACDGLVKRNDGALFNRVFGKTGKNSGYEKGIVLKVAGKRKRYQSK